MSEVPARATAGLSAADTDSDWSALVRDIEKMIEREHYLESEKLALKALEHAEMYKPDDRRVGITLELLSQIYFFTHQYHYGAPVIMRLLQMYRRCLGHDHLDTGTITHNAAMLYHSWSKFEEASVFYQQAVYIKSAKLGQQHPDVERIRRDYAQFMRDFGRSKGRRTSALATYRRGALPIDQAQPGALGEAEAQALAAAAAAPAERVDPVPGAGPTGNPELNKNRLKRSGQWTQMIAEIAGDGERRLQDN
jgi:hypothetical protein